MFAECMLVGCQSVEDGIDQITIQEFELLLYPDKTYPRVDILRDHVGFGVKLDLLVTIGRISKNDKKAILDFYKERNALFHGDIFTSLHPVALPEAEKTRLMELAGKASQIAQNRKIGFGRTKERVTWATFFQRSFSRSQSSSPEYFAQLLGAVLVALVEGLLFVRLMHKTKSLIGSGIREGASTIPIYLIVILALVH